MTDSAELLTSILRDVSRSFYLTLRALPARVRHPIGLAYLLARASDTVADTEAVPVESRLATLEAMRRCWLQGGDSPDFSRFLEGLPPGAVGNPKPAEVILMRRMSEASRLLNRCEPADRERIRRVLEIITGGQTLDIQRFAGAGDGRILALSTDAELDDYTYRVAGCVGEFWTRICRAHLFPEAVIDEAALLEDGVRFGKGLQLVNILRDLPRDLREGRCYIPSQRLGEIGLVPEDLLDADRQAIFAPLYHSLLDRAQGHLSAGWRYTNTLPRGCHRVRLACSWPVLIGIQTLEMLRVCGVLDAGVRIKVPKSAVRSILFRTLWAGLIPSVWLRLDDWALRNGRRLGEQSRSSN